MLYSVQSTSAIVTYKQPVSITDHVEITLRLTEKKTPSCLLLRERQRSSVLPGQTNKQNVNNKHNVFRFENPGKDALEDEEVKAEEDAAATDPDDDKYKKHTKKLTTWMALGTPEQIRN